MSDDVEVSKPRVIQRVLAVKLGLDLKKKDDLGIYRRLIALSWDAMKYGNNHIRAVWAEAIGLRVDPERGDPHDLTKHIRRYEKGELSGAAYSAIEREARGMWTRMGKRVMGGAPLPEFREGRALSIRGHAKNQSESGVRLTFESGRFIAHLQAQAATCEGGSWIRIPLAKGTEIDDYQAPLLHRMAAWDIPITKATISIQKEKHRVTLRLTYPQVIALPEMGSRVATLGPLTKHGNRLMLRTECDNRDYSSRLALVSQGKAKWDQKRRRACIQIGKRHGSARLKRMVIANTTWDQWLDTHLHQWSAEMIHWLELQGIGRLSVIRIGNGDWPAHRFTAMLKYKGESRGITVTSEEEADIAEPSTARAVKSEIQRQRKRSKKAADAIRELNYQFGQEDNHGSVTGSAGN